MRRRSARHPLLTILRSSGLFNPSDYATVGAWYDSSVSSSIVQDGSGNISQWDDLSGNDNHMMQSTASAQPTYLSTSDGVDFDGTEWMTASDSPTLDYTTFHIYAVVEPNSSASTGNILSKYLTSGNKREFRFDLNTSNAPVLQTSATGSSALVTAASSDTLAVGKTGLVEAGFDGTNIFSSLNGGTKTETASSGVYNDTSSLGMGALNVDGSAIIRFDGKIKEIIFYTEELTAENQATVRNHLLSKWGIS